ncbi:glycine--tRNA ligase [archaeon]|nr:MAG: glycine--tRNA ligase [archaeon]
MPFAAAQIGLGFRNEIAPRNGLLRVREFCMAEIEHFVNPNNKQHPKFPLVADKVLTLFPSDNQMTTGRTVQITMGEAVRTGLVNNETLGYFMARTQMWLEKVGVDPARMRFRQHLKTEMAHYAADCWDMEIQMSYGWIECVGHADRACYDLDQHSKRTSTSMVASERLAEPVQIEKTIAEPNKKLIGPRFKGDQKTVITAIESLTEDQVAELKSQMDRDGKGTVAGFEITPDLVTFITEKKVVVESKYTPSVIEPSFGIGRIMHAILEHSFSQRSGDMQRCVMAFKPCVAPVKVGIFRLINHGPFDPVVDRLKQMLMSSDLSTRVDSSSGSVGRRYARSDELGIPFGITVDFQTLLDQTVTLRDRDSMAQVRIPIQFLVSIVKQLVEEKITWAYVMQRYVVVKTGGDEEAGEEGEEEDNNEAAENKEAVVTDKPVILQHTSRGAFSRPNPHYKA